MAQSIYKILLIIQICLSVKINQVLSKQIVKNVPKNLTKTIEHLQLLRQTIKPQIINSTETTEVIVTKQRPCSCANGLCSCCSRMLLNTWNQKACVNVTYDPDEFSFTTKLLMNDRILYTRTISGKNPRPVCVPMPRIPAIKACVRLYNIYFQGRNVHACVSMEGKLSDTTLFKMGLDCIRLGANGVALVRPEDGGGLGQVEFLPDTDDDTDDDYDEDNDDTDDDDYDDY